MAKQEESKQAGKIATFSAKYSNTSTGSNYRSAIESFLRCIFGLEKGANDYESLFDTYLRDKKRDRSADIKMWSECLVRECVSKQSARQRLTYGVKVLKAHGVTINQEDVQDIKRETKGGAATVDKVMTADVICKTLRSADTQIRALILVLASSGMRINEALSLTMKDIDFNLDPVMVNVRSDVSKNGYARYSFISTEARDALYDYLKVRDEFVEKAEVYAGNLTKAGKKATVNTETELLFPLQDSSVNKKWESALRKAGLYSRDEKSGRNQYRIHSLRKFFISQLSLAGHKTLAEHLAGHTGYLDASYRQVSPEFAAREYKKLQSILTCCIPESIKAGIKMADEKISVLMEKTELQSESVEGLKIINNQLREQMRKESAELNRKIAVMSERIDQQGKMIDKADEIMKLFLERIETGQIRDASERK